MAQLAMKALRSWCRDRAWRRHKPGLNQDINRPSDGCQGDLRRLLSEAASSLSNSQGRGPVARQTPTTAVAGRADREVLEHATGSRRRLVAGAISASPGGADRPRRSWQAHGRAPRGLAGGMGGCRWAQIVPCDLFEQREQLPPSTSPKRASDLKRHTGRHLCEFSRMHGCRRYGC